MKKTLSLLAAVLMFSAVNAQSIFSENFNSVASGQMPTGWTVYADNLANDAHYSSFNQSWQVVPMNEAGTEKAMASISRTQVSQDCDRWAITPAINIPSAGYKLTFSVYGNDYRFPEKVSVRVSTTGTDTATFTEVRDIVMDNVSASAGHNAIMVDLDSYAGQTVYIAFVNHGDGNYTIIDDVEVTIPPANEIFCLGALTGDLYLAGADAQLTIGVYNLGASNLTSFDYSYTINNGTPVTGTINGINVAYGNYHVFNLTYNFPTASLVNIDVTVSNPNGQTDPTPADNSASTHTRFYDPTTTVERTSLLEHFTTGQCQYCPAGHQRLNQAYQGYENSVCWVAHHVGYGTDDLTLDESEQLIDLYGSDGPFAPAFMLDRNAANASEPAADGVVGRVGQATDIASQFQSALSVPAFATISMSNLSYDAQTRQISVTVSGNFSADFDASRTRLSLYLTEDNIVSRQYDAAVQGWVNDYVHNHVIRATLSDVWGDAAFTTTNAGDTYSKTYTYTLPATMRPEKCRLVAFVNELGPSMRHRQVANATQSGYLVGSTTGISDVEASINVRTYPNPAVEMAYIQAESTIRSYKMVDAMGRIVINEDNVNADMIELDVRGLAQGVYFINVTTDNGSASQRISIVK